MSGARHLILLVWLVLFGLTGGCVTVSVAPLTEQNHGYGQSEDEQKLIRRAVQFESELRAKGLILNDEAVTAYVQRVGQALIPTAVDGALPIRFHVLRDPLVNAFALPNGGIYLNVGLLARLENEAQLAHVIGHEIAHVVQRHGLQQHHSRKATIIAAHIADVALFGTSIAYLPALGALASYSQEAETESDQLALEYMSRAGYSLQGAEELFKLLQEVNQRESIWGSVYSSHPDNAKRTSDTQALLTSRHNQVRGGRTNIPDYMQIRDRIVLENLRLKLNIHQYALTVKIADQDLARSPASPWLHYYRGEAYRMMAEDPVGAAREDAWIRDEQSSSELVERFRQQKAAHLDKARQSYRQALDHDQDFVTAHRGLGLVAYAEGDHRTAREELKRYLDRGRDISDRRYINNILGRIQQ
jgi:predicted Zn-dependent protease